MSEEIQTGNGAEPESPLAGQRLAAARREREISVLDIAKELHLDEAKVRALENNEFEILGAPVFAKGHLRKYAELVGVSIDDILADYYALNRAVGAPPVVGRARPRQRDIRPGPWILAILAILVTAGAVYWWLGRTVVPEVSPGIVSDDAALADSTPADPPNDQPVAAPPTPAVDADGAPPEPPAGDTVAEPAPAIDTSVADVASAAAPGFDGPAVTLGIRFSGDCWTEVTDASGTRLFFDLGRAGRSVTVSGEAPLRALFGNGDNVSLTVDGADYPIRASMRRGQTARLTINAQ